MVTEEVLRDVIKEAVNESDLMKVLNDEAFQSRTASLWVDCFITPTFLSTLYVRAEREADWPFHLLTVKEKLPYFFCCRPCELCTLWLVQS